MLYGKEFEVTKSSWECLGINIFTDSKPPKSRVMQSLKIETLAQEN